MELTKENAKEKKTLKGLVYVGFTLSISSYVFSLFYSLPQTFYFPSPFPLFRFLLHPRKPLNLFLIKSFILYF